MLAAPGRPSFDRYSHLPTSLFGSGVEVMSAIANRLHDLGCSTPLATAPLGRSPFNKCVDPFACILRGRDDFRRTCCCLPPVLVTGLEL